MCVIIIKPCGAKMPDERELNRAYMCNPDGCGFVSEKHFYKGLSFQAFKKKLSEVGEDEACIMHFRLATNGSIRRANCHPFKRGDVYFAHNGVLSIRPAGDKTDSQTAFDDILYPIIEEYGLDSKELKTAVNGIIGHSKFAFLQNGQITTFGEFIRHDGRLYSNLRHLNTPWSFDFNDLF